MAQSVSSLPGYYTCQPPGSLQVLHLSLELVDRILAEVLTGFGAIPRRGAEVGGILLGRRDKTEVWIDEFAVVPCEHRRGPSYLLSEQDLKAFSERFEYHRDRDRYPVGLFRSHTRDQPGATDDDCKLFTDYFPAAEGVFLLIRPRAAATSTATFSVCRNGVFEEADGGSFPFQRWELEGGSAPRRRALGEPKAPRSTPLETSLVAAGPDHSQAVLAPDAEVEEGVAPVEEPVLTPRMPPPQKSPAPARRGAWLWIPLSVVFLLVGIVLGFQSALTLYPHTAAIESPVFGLGLAAAGKDENLHIKWNREAPAIRNAQSGRLEIKDGSYVRTVDLDTAALQTGSVIYPPLSDTVSLRFQVNIRGNNSVVETLSWTKPKK